MTMALHNLARDPRVFVNTVNGAQAVITIGDDQLAIALVSYKQQWRELCLRLDPLQVLFDKRVAALQVP